MTLFLAAFGLALMMEGLLYAAFPDLMKKMLASILSMPASSLRIGALICAGGGLLILALAVGI